KKATLYTILSILVPLACPILLLIIASKAKKYHTNPIEYEIKNGPCRPFIVFNSQANYNENNDSNQ
ncbi:MAG: hypothetical protein RR483_02840, partial [Clostridia bacterium]